MPRLCQQGFLNTYLEYTQGQQAPTRFHLWSAITTIAAVLQRNVWLDRGFYTLYPNLYSVLVSPSGVGTKSTALDIGTDLQEKAVPTITIMRGKLTIPYLVDWMSTALTKNPDGGASVTIVASEFKVFTSGMGTSSLIEDLTELYDCRPKWDYRTKNSGVYEIQNPCINLRAASTPEWLSVGNAADLVGGGFFSRLIPIAITKDEKSIAWPKKTANELVLEEQLVHDLTEISKLRGKFFIPKASYDYFEKWYDKRHTDNIDDERLRGYYSKRHDMVLKVAMTLAISADDELVLHPNHIKGSLTLLKQLEENMQFAYSGVSWGGEATKEIDKVLCCIRDSTDSKIDHSSLMRKFHYRMTRDELQKVIETLLVSELIDKEVVQTGTKPKLYYCYCGEKLTNKEETT